jgi:hypothetical protein
LPFLNFEIQVSLLNLSLSADFIIYKETQLKYLVKIGKGVLYFESLEVSAAAVVGVGGAPNADQVCSDGGCCDVRNHARVRCTCDLKQNVVVCFLKFQVRFLSKLGCCDRTVKYYFARSGLIKRVYKF